MADSEPVANLPLRRRSWLVSRRYTLSEPLGVNLEACPVLRKASLPDSSAVHPDDFNAAEREERWCPFRVTDQSADEYGGFPELTGAPTV